MRKHINLPAVVLGFLAVALAGALFGGPPAAQEERLGPVPRGVLEEFTHISKDGCHVAMVCRRGDKWRMVVDGKPGLEYDEIPCVPIFSSDSKRVAYPARTGKQGNRELVVVDGQPGPAYDILLSEPRFLPDGTVVYLAEREKVLYRVKQPPPNR